MLHFGNLIRDSHHLPSSWSEATLTLFLPVKEIPGYSPAKRSNNIIQQYVLKDQIVFRAGQNLTTNIRKMLDIINHCTLQQFRAILLALEIERELDSLKLNYL